MSNLLEQCEQDLRTCILEAVGRAILYNQLPADPIGAFSIERPADNSHGDYATNVALISAKNFKLPPRKIAEIVLANIVLEGTDFARCEIAGPGFINFFFADSFYAHVLAHVMECGEHYGESDYGKGEKYMVEFVSANPTGPMHMGNARGGALGDCLAAVLQKAGYDVTREFYINDAGNQIDKFGISLEARYLGLFLGEQQVPFPEDGYQGEDIRTRAKEFAAQFGSRYVKAEPAERRQALIDFALPRNIEKMREDLNRYNIQFDNWFHESSLYTNGELNETLALMKERGLTYEKDGALWYKATEHGGEKDEVLVRANGHSTYFAADIAYHRNKLQTRSYKTVIDIWGADHHGHVARMKGALDAIGLDGSRLDVILMQLVRLTRAGEVVRMSKRTGKSITLSDLLEEIPVDAARFFFNMREANAQMDFDLDLAVEQSSKNPVYYVQYAHARICSILRKLEEEGITPRPCTKTQLQQLQAPEERELILHLAKLPEEIIQAAKNYEPVRLTRYVMDLASLFHKFYNTCRVKGEAESLMQARILLCVAVRDTLYNCLSMLKISAPRSM